MLRGDKVVLRAITRDDVEQLHGWETDHAEWPLVSDQAHLPTTLAETLSSYDEGKRWRASETNVPFAIEAEGAFVGTVSLWGIDLFNRRAHLGIALAPPARGQGWASDAIRVLLRYAFDHRGLHRVQLEVLTDNLPAIRAYEAVGFVLEGTARQSGWVEGRFVDEQWMSVLAPEFRARV